jgi:hypothetical protein
MSTEIALFQIVHILEKSLKHKEIALGDSWILRGHSTIPLSMQYLRQLESVDLKRLAVGGSGPFLKGDLYTLLLWAEV